MEDLLIYPIKFIDESSHRTDREKFVIKIIPNSLIAEVPIRMIYENDFAEYEMTFTNDKSGYVHRHIYKPHITDCTIKLWEIDTSISLTLEIYKSLFISFMERFDE